MGLLRTCVRNKHSRYDLSRVVSAPAIATVAAFQSSSAKRRDKKLGSPGLGRTDRSSRPVLKTPGPRRLSASNEDAIMSCISTVRVLTIAASLPLLGGVGI